MTGARLSQPQQVGAREVCGVPAIRGEFAWISDLPGTPAAPVLPMTRELAAARAVGDPDSPAFDGTAFLRSLKK